MEGDVTWGSEHTIQYTNDILQNCTAETYVILLTNVTPINSILKIKIRKEIHGQRGKRGRQTNNTADRITHQAPVKQHPITPSQKGRENKESPFRILQFKNDCEI